MLNKKIILLMLIISCNSFIIAKTLYVNGATGNDAVTYANNNSNSPWATIGRAVWGSANRPASVDNDTPPTSSQAAQAGDTVLVSSGTYHTTQGTAGNPNWDVVLYSTANEGSPGNPIVIKAVGQVILTSANNGQPVIGARLRDYIEWHGFTIDASNNNLPTYERTLCAVVVTRYTKIIGNTIIGSPNITAGPGNNTNCIYIHTSQNITIANNTLTGTGGISGENNAAITGYNNHNIVCEYNTVYCVNSGFYFKAPQSGQTQTNITFRYNKFIGGSEAQIRFLTNEPSGGTMGQVYQNLLMNGAIGIAITPITNEWRDVDSLHVVNNTIYNNTYGIHIGAGNIFDDNRVYNNIVVNCDYAMWSYDNSDDANFRSEYDSDHNCWYNNHPSIFYLCNNNYSYAQWQSQFFNGNADANSLTQNPLFVDENNDLFQLQPASPCTTGLDILDLDNDFQTNDAINMGCYITGNEIIGAGGSINIPSKSFTPVITR